MKNETKEIRYIDLFGGVGGFRLGIERANGLRHLQSEMEEGQHSRNIKTEFHKGEQKWDGYKTKCIYYCDSDKYAVQTYNKNFGENYEATDIRTIKADSIPDFDMLCGGFPCQAFSIAGKRRGFQDTRGTLFFEIARIIKAKRPKIIFLENVKGLLNHNKGQTFSIIIQTLSELGYDVQWMVLNSKFFGVPQNRERVFIIGSLGGTSRPEILPFGFSSSEDVEQNREKQKEQSWVSTLDSRYGQRWSQETYVGTYRTHKDGQGFREMKKNISPTIPSRAREDGSGQPIIAIPVLTPDRENKRQHGRRFKEDGEPSFTLTGQDVHGVAIMDLYNNKEHTDRSPTLTEPHHNSLRVRENMQIRRLTPIECERLQGFPDGWTEKGINEKGEEVLISDTQRYKMMGNAVTTNVIQAIAEKLLCII